MKEKEKKKGSAMKTVVRTLSIIDVTVCFLSQILLILFAVLLLAFGKKLSEGDFAIPDVFSDIMLVFILTFFFDVLILFVLLFFRQIKYDKVYRKYFSFTDWLYITMTAVLPIFFWQMWMTYDFRVRALIFSLILQFMIILNSFFKDRYLKQYLKNPEKPGEPKKSEKEPVETGGSEESKPDGEDGNQ